jgi:iron complex transport system substrate-binding protein
MIGTSYQTDPVLPELAGAYRKVPVLAKLYPSREAVLNARPDFVYSTFTSAYAADAAGSRADLAELGVPAYLSRFACEEPEQGEKAVTFDGIFAEITEVATLLGVGDRGAEVVAGQRARLDAAKQAAPRTSSELLWYYSGTKTPYVAGAGGLPAAIGEQLGVGNAYGDAAQTWPAGNWEEIAARNPDVIVVADLTRGGDGDSAQSKIDFLRADPVTSKLDAVRGGRFITVSGSSMDPSIRSVTAVEQVSAGLAELNR